MRYLYPVIYLVLILTVACQSSAPIDYSTQVKPILNKRCISCHGGVRKKGGFSLLFEEEAKAQLTSGAYAIIPGDPGESEMIRRLRLTDEEERMPYHQEMLPDEEVAILRRWIKEGAQWGKHWAYEPIEEPVVPGSGNLKDVSAIDAFIHHKLQQQGLESSPEAKPATLARRAALDIIGFPAPDSLKAEYLEAPGDETYQRYVDNLLTSPHFGEKWASMWLDLARYADTKGYERDPGREIWRYRDWLIKALNNDVPYDTFITWQLAGDLLPDPSDDQYIATAFHRNSMTNDEGGTDNEEFRTAAVIDRVNTTWESFMGTTFACVQCHSHPYDPFTHEEYYQFAAFFNNTRDEDTNADYPLFRHYDDDQIALVDQVTQWMDEHATNEEKAEIVRFVKTLSPARNSLTTDQFVNAELADTKWLAFRNHASARLSQQELTGMDRLRMRYQIKVPNGRLEVHLDSVDGPLIASRNFPTQKGNGGWFQEEIPIRSVTGFHDVFFTYEHPEPTHSTRKHLMFDWFYFTRELPGSNQKGFDKVKAAYETLVTEDVPTTPIMIENPESLNRTTHVFERGNWTVKGKQVEAGVPAIFAEMGSATPDRLDLAKWLTDDKNPLTSRTIVNRVWEQLFGRGLVETLEDLGTQGAPPTHPELLDYLSWQMMNDYRWSLKTLIREVVLSETYRQSSKVRPEDLERDPSNIYLSRMPRIRLSAEQVRDQALAISGTLNPTMYGPPVMPYQPAGIWSSPYNGSKWVPSEEAQQYRRAIYIYWKRTSPYPSMITFDGVGREVCASRRIRTNTPLQALVLLNDSVFVDISRKFANKVYSEAESDEQISRAYWLATGEQIDSFSLKALEGLYREGLAHYKENPDDAQRLLGKHLAQQDSLAALSIVANAILNLDEVVMKN